MKASPLRGVLAWAPLAALLLGCGTSPQAGAGTPDRSGAPGRAAGPVVLRGTAIEASTGFPLVGVFVVGPGGVRAESDAEGRFELVGLAVGAVGELVGTTEDGLAGKNRLRPLRSGELEVVLYLR